MKLEWELQRISRTTENLNYRNYRESVKSVRQMKEQICLVDGSRKTCDSKQLSDSRASVSLKGYTEPGRSGCSSGTSHEMGAEAGFPSLGELVRTRQVLVLVGWDWGDSL